MFTNEIAIDLGTSSVLIYKKGRGVILNEPSVIAINKRTKNAIAVGKKAEKMIGRTPSEIEIIRPINNGVISDLTATEKMIKLMMPKSVKGISAPTTYMMSVPSQITDVEQRAVIEVARSLGGRDIYVIEKAMASALGVGIDVTLPNGSLVVDIGGGTTDIAVISIGKVIAGRTLKFAGNMITDSLIRYIRKEYNIALGEMSAEFIKSEIGCASRSDSNNSIEVKGQSLVSGLPTSIILSSNDIYHAFDEIVDNIIERIKDVLEETPVRLQADILSNGVTLSGGGSMLKNFNNRIETECGIRVNVTENPIKTTVIGAGRALGYINKTEKRFFKKAYIV